MLSISGRCIKALGRRNQLKMTGLTFGGRVQRAEKRRLQKEKEAAALRLKMLKLMLGEKIEKPNRKG